MAASDVESNKGNSAWGTQGNPITIIPKYDDVHAQLMSILVDAGSTPKARAKWIVTFMPGVAKLPR
jgi:phage terminase small subunit